MQACVRDFRCGALPAGSNRRISSIVCGLNKDHAAASISLLPVIFPYSYTTLSRRRMSQADANTIQTHRPNKTRTGTAGHDAPESEAVLLRRALSRWYAQPPVPLVTLSHLIGELSEERGCRGVLRNRVRELCELLHFEKHFLARFVSSFLLGDERADILNVRIRHGDHCGRTADHPLSG